MEPAERDLLQRNLALAEENNKLLHSMRRSQRWHGVMRVVWWLIVFGASAAFYYYYVWPYMQQVLALYQQMQQGGQRAQDAITQLQNLLPWFFPNSTSTPR